MTVYFQDLFVETSYSTFFQIMQYKMSTFLTTSRWQTLGVNTIVRTDKFSGSTLVLCSKKKKYIYKTEIFKSTPSGRAIYQIFQSINTLIGMSVLSTLARA